MKKNLLLSTIILALLVVSTLTVLVITSASQQEYPDEITETQVQTNDNDASSQDSTDTVTQDPANETSLLTVYPGGVLDTSNAFTSRDLVQSPNIKEAIPYTVSDSSDIHITEEGIYVLSGTADNVTIYVEADDEAKVQLVLYDLSITNQDFPCIYVISADKVFVTTIDNSSLSVTGTFHSDGETNTDGVIFSRSDLVLNGTASLSIDSTDNGVVSKDDLKITGGMYNIDAASKAIEANDSIRIAGGTLNLTAGTDGLHAENDKNDALGYVYIYNGTLSIQAGDDGIHGTSVVQIDNGTIYISAAEGIEGTCIQINGGSIEIESWDDGINGANKSTAYTTGIEINYGKISVTMAAGDTDGIDTNGNLTINGGTINITANSSFDCDGTVSFNGGTVIVNGQEVETIPNQAGMSGSGRGGSHDHSW